MSDHDPTQVDWASYQNLTFEDFKTRAKDPSLNSYEKIGYPTFYRKGKDAATFHDIQSKVKNLNASRKVILDIGSGCSELALLLIQHCKEKEHDLFMIDSEEMLNQLPLESGFKKIAGHFPNSFSNFIYEYKEKVDAIICYGVISTVFLEMNIFKFIDKALCLLRSEGELLIGDIPNNSKRNRFFSSEVGLEFHKKFMKTSSPPQIEPVGIQSQKMDDSIVLSILQRYRGFGFNTYVLPQAQELTMANRREDILIQKP